MLGKAITDLRDPAFVPPTRPVRKHFKNTDGTATTDRATDGKANIAVMDDLDYAVETGDYSRKISRYETHLEVIHDRDVRLPVRSPVRRRRVVRVLEVPPPRATDGATDGK